MNSPAPPDRKSVTYFLNVDLDIEGQDIVELVKAFESRASVLHHTSTKASFELLDQPPDPDTAIRDLCAVIEALPSEARQRWDECTRRTFSIGISAGVETHSRSWALAPDTLRLITQLRANIDVTVYAPCPEFNIPA
ncbi:hypothetical protein MYSTI_02102 [Myxococcus stipitatus DSM 14675]|uniref:DUF4279 domain-containing protein n=1 Tax=Myxococcus stipitatus (strain DSM 14675 / JCM 12634 / Mx s8) TaxID=1278073 RepID=L7U3W0_MYXSD|nr:hypothetical protein [Myxococcus stipitatus]AGC43431.1 hypothetical protein MYSTI_02102 [Myxococcus stipitatus DSM 14675]